MSEYAFSLQPKIKLPVTLNTFFSILEEQYMLRNVKTRETLETKSFGALF